MKKRNLRSLPVLGFALVLLGAVLLAGCNTQARVGAMQTESKSVELGDAKSVRVDINMGAGDLALAGGSAKLLEAGFTYNVSKLKPAVEYKNGTLTVRQPEAKGFPDLRGIQDFRNQWDVRLNDGVPMDLKVNVGGGTGDLALAGLSLTGLEVDAGAGKYKIDLSGDWARDLNADIEAGAATVTLRLPKDAGVRVRVESGPHTIDAPGLTKDGDVYTNAAYGVSDVTLDIQLQVGVGQIIMEVEQ